MQAPTSARQDLSNWQTAINSNVFTANKEFQHTLSMYFADNRALSEQLKQFGEVVAQQLIPLVHENNFRFNLPRLEAYDGIGNRIDKIIHHPNYAAAGELIYKTDLLKQFAAPGGILQSFCFLYLSGHAGEAGHNCPLACSAGIIRVLQRFSDTPNAEYYLKKLITPSYQDNFTGAQFLTEIQGGSDVGKNAVIAYQDEEKNWRIRGEKWFCSNANADLILMTARYDESVPGTKGLGLFLVPTILHNGEHNHFRIRRLKEKIGTCSMASGEIDFLDAHATPINLPENGFKIVMENVLHISRLFNTIIVLGMVQYAYQIAYHYAKNRHAFGDAIINYPLVIENLATIKAENTAGLAAIFATTALQDEFDCSNQQAHETALLLRTLANINKYSSALWGVEHIHHCIDMLAGNGAIESFSELPRLLRDSIVCENWEGTHNTLRLQTLRDIHKYQIDKIFIAHISERLASLEQSKQQKNLSSQLQRLQDSCAELKAASPELQTLLIKTVLDLMAQLYLAVSLLTEAQHQLTNNDDKTKLHCFDYFYTRHFNQSPHYDEAYLRLIKQVLQIN